LLQAGANIVVVSPALNAQLTALVRENKIVCVRRNFPRKICKMRSWDCRDFCSKRERAVYRAADARGLLCNAVDDIETAILLGAVCSAAICNCISTTERALPGARLRKELEAQFGVAYENWIEWLGAARMHYALRARRKRQTKKCSTTLRARKASSGFARSQRKATTEGVE